MDLSVVVVRNGLPVLEYDAAALEIALLSKHARTAYVQISSKRKDGVENASDEAVQYCEGPSIISLLNLIREGSEYLDLTMSEKANGAIRDHGFLWRIRGEDLPRLYINQRAINLGAV